MPLTALLLLAARAAQRGHGAQSGALIGAAAALKLTPAVFLLGPLARGERRTLVWGTAVALALVALPALAIQGPERALSFHSEVVERLAALARTAATADGGRGSQDVGSVVLRWFGPVAAPLGRISGLALAALLVVRMRGVRDAGLGFAHLALAVPLCIAPTWSHGLAALPAAAWFVWCDPSGSRWSRGAALGAVLLVSLPLHALFTTPEAHAVAGLGGAATLLLTGALLLRRADAHGGVPGTR